MSFDIGPYNPLKDCFVSDKFANIPSNKWEKWFVDAVIIAIADAWKSEHNKKKVFDPDLADAILLNILSIGE